mgnify:CR=1 FL=1
MSREIDDAEKFENLSQLCEEMTGRPWDGTVAHLNELSTRQQETTEILEVHAEWLSRLRNRALGSGHDWTTEELRHQARLDGDLTVIPEWMLNQGSTEESA